MTKANAITVRSDAPLSVSLMPLLVSMSRSKLPALSNEHLFALNVLSTVLGICVKSSLTITNNSHQSLCVSDLSRGNFIVDITIIKVDAFKDVRNVFQRDI